MLGRIARRRGLRVFSTAKGAATRYGASSGAVPITSTDDAPIAHGPLAKDAQTDSRPGGQASKLVGEHVRSRVAFMGFAGRAAFSTGGAIDAESYSVCEDDGGEKGLVAGRPLRRGDVVFDRIRGVMLDNPNRFTIQISDDQHLETCSDLRLMNHGCEPNCRMEINLSEQDPYLRVVVMEPVEPEEWLTIDYNAMEIEMSSPFDCTCGTPSCSGLVAGFSRLPIDVRNEYIGPKSNVNDAEWMKPMRLTPLVRAWAVANKDTPPRA